MQKIPPNRQKVLSDALNALREVMPDTPLILVTAFSIDELAYDICCASNIDHDGQHRLLSEALQSFNLAPEGTTLN